MAFGAFSNNFDMRQKYALAFTTPLTHYHAHAFIVRCFDDRFRPVFEKFLKAQKIKNADFESVAGGAKIFASPERKSDRDFMFRELEKSIKLHHAKRVILFTHYDCGAYGGIKRFGDNEEKQYEFHRTEHKRAVAALKIKFADMRIETYFMDRKGIIKILS